MSDFTPIIIKTLKKHGVKKAAFFGSYARGEQREMSDIDILITPPEKMNLIGLIGLKQEIEDQIKIAEDRKTGDATIRNFEVIGEAIKILMKSFLKTTRR